MNLTPLTRVEHFNRIVQGHAEAVFGRVNARGRGWPGVVREAVEGFQAHNGFTQAAAIAYYTLFAIFPLVLFLAALAGPFVRSQAAQASILSFFSTYLPGSSDAIREAINQTIQERGAVGALSAVGFFWSASGMFPVINRAINRAWLVDRSRSAWQEKLLHLALVVGIALAIIASFVLSITFHFRPVGRRAAALPVRPISPLRQALSNPVFLNFVVPFIFTGLVFFVMYRLIPHTRVRAVEALAGAIPAAMLWEVAKYVFGLYLAGSLEHYRAVYGSLSTVVVLLLWLYFTGAIIVLGGEFSAAWARWRRSLVSS